MNKIKYVGKIGSMALINSADNEIDYNIFARICHELTPGWAWVTSGAMEIGRLDYMKRNNGAQLADNEAAKTDYCSQGQAILMQTYRQFIKQDYSIRQLLVEHQHFNNEAKRGHIKEFLLRCAEQNAIPIINYNDSVSSEETRKSEIRRLSDKGDKVYELVDNDETAAQTSRLLNAEFLLILTGVDGIYKNPADPSTLIKKITGKDKDELLFKITETQKNCFGASRKAAGGAKAKLEYIKDAATEGTKIIIANSKYKISDIMSGRVISTFIGIE